MLFLKNKNYCFFYWLGARRCYRSLPVNFLVSFQINFWSFWLIFEVGFLLVDSNTLWLLVGWLIGWLVGWLNLVQFYWIQSHFWAILTTITGYLGVIFSRFIRSRFCYAQFKLIADLSTDWALLPNFNAGHRSEFSNKLAAKQSLFSN